MNVTQVFCETVVFSLVYVYGKFCILYFFFKFIGLSKVALMETVEDNCTSS